MKSPCGVKFERKSFAGERQIEDDAIVRVRSRRDGRRQAWWRDSVERLSEAKNGGRRAKELGAWESNGSYGCAEERRHAGRLQQRAARLRWRAAVVARGCGGA
jgi:hypothetical protein